MNKKKTIKNSKSEKKVNKSTRSVQVEPLELGKETPTSVISVSREFTLNVNIIDPKVLDELYQTVPEISRAVDLRGFSMISRGFEVSARKVGEEDEASEEAKKFADICLKIINNSGGVSLIEQWQKNADLYGNGYLEMVDDAGKVNKLVPVHPFQFGYELEEFTQEGQVRTRVKLDKNTQEPVGYATYKFDQTKNIFVNDKPIELERIAHLKYKVIGDAVYGTSIVQPMYGSVLRKLQIENHTEAAARLVSSPKIVISGEFADDEEARNEAKEAASLDVSDVVVLQNDRKFEIINPGQTNLPELREMFISNITTSTGIPRPVLTSEGSDINKATIQELLRVLNENMRSDMNRIKQVMETKIFRTIGENYSINDFENIIPRFDFPPYKDEEDDQIVREERKAATLTSLSNSLQLLNNQLLTVGSDSIGPYQEAINATLNLYSKTAEGFDVNNDQGVGKIEEVENPELTLSVGIYNSYSIEDQIDTINQRIVLERQHYLIHQAFKQQKQGDIVRDANTGNDISMIQLFEKHRFYVDKMVEHGFEHQLLEEGKELDDFYYKFFSN